MCFLLRNLEELQRRGKPKPKIKTCAKATSKICQIQSCCTAGDQPEISGSPLLMQWLGCNYFPHTPHLPSPGESCLARIRQTAKSTHTFFPHSMMFVLQAFCLKICFSPLLLKILGLPKLLMCESETSLNILSKSSLYMLTFHPN